MPTPSQLAKSGTEHGEQVALFAFCAMAQMRGWQAAKDDKCYTEAGYADKTYGTANAIPDLKWFHAIPNGGSRGDDAKSRAIRGGQLKAEGQKNGVMDTFWPYPSKAYLGLYIEMKKSDLCPKTANSKGGLSDEQIEFGDYVHRNGYAVFVAYSWMEAAQRLESYYSGGRMLYTMRKLRLWHWKLVLSNREFAKVQREAGNTRYLAPYFDKQADMHLGFVQVLNDYVQGTAEGDLEDELYKMRIARR